MRNLFVVCVVLSFLTLTACSDDSTGPAVQAPPSAALPDNDPPQPTPDPTDPTTLSTEVLLKKFNQKEIEISKWLSTQTVERIEKQDWLIRGNFNGGFLRGEGKIGGEAHSFIYGPRFYQVILHSSHTKSLAEDMLRLANGGYAQGEGILSFIENLFDSHAKTHNGMDMNYFIATFTKFRDEFEILNVAIKDRLNILSSDQLTFYDRTVARAQSRFVRFSFVEIPSTIRAEGVSQLFSGAHYFMYDDKGNATSFKKAWIKNYDFHLE